MIIKRNFNPVKVAAYVQTELVVSALVSIAALALYLLNGRGIILPFSIAGILGSGLAIFIGFRNNSSYSRWWEARTLWGGIVNSSRVFARLAITFTDSHQHQTNYEKSRSEAFKTGLVHLAIGWAHALRMHLRQQDKWEDLRPYVTQSEYALLNRAENKPNYIHLLIGRKIYEAMANGILAGFDSFQLEGQLLSLANYQSGCERIKNTPLLRQYDFFARVFMYTFITLLPFCLLADLAKLGQVYLVVPVSVVISFVFAIIGKVGQVNEDPFENQITDVPLTALCATIERDLLEMLDETSLPSIPEPENGYLF